MGLNNKFTIMKSLPAKGNKFYNTKSNGGWSRCIQGSPARSGRNVYSNCVGHACSRYNEVYSLLTGYNGMKYSGFNCNAENFVERAKKTYGLAVVPYPVLGGIMVWQRGTLSSKDGAGHVEFVEDIYSKNSIYTSSSGWGASNPFWNAKRSNSNGRWGMSEGYKFIGCIVNPAIGDVHYDMPVQTDNTTQPSTLSTSNYSKGNYKTLANMYVRTGAGTNYSIKKVSQLTADGKRNATSSNKNANAIYKKGTIFTAREIINQNGVWAKTPSGYVCIKGKSGTVYCKKI